MPATPDDRGVAAGRMGPPVREADLPWGYNSPRDEVTVLVPPGAVRVLDVGCATGLMAESLRRRGHQVTGVEMDPYLASLARPRTDRLLECDIETMVAEGRDPGGPFDCVVLADVLEHLRDPWAVTRWAAGLLAPAGCLVISVPNIRHAETFWTLAARRRWPYKDVGIFDRTHLRFFARSNLPALLEGTDLAITELHRSYLLVHRRSRINRLAPLLGDLGTLQFIFRAERAVAGPAQPETNRAQLGRRSMRRRPTARPDATVLTVGATPAVAFVRRDPELGVAFIKDRIDRRGRAGTGGNRGDGAALGDDDVEAVAREVAVHPWYHTIDLPGGIVTSGFYDHRPVVPLYGIPAALEGKRVLDVATADGFWAFEFERRGANVTALDIDSTDDVDLPRPVRALATERGYVDSLGDGFTLAHRLLKSGVDKVTGTIYDLDPERLGHFDLVHAGDILLHLRDPMRALEQIRRVTAPGGQVLLSDVFEPGLRARGRDQDHLVRYLGGWHTAGWWIPSLDTLVQMVADGGFSVVEVIATYSLPPRGQGSGPWRAVMRALP